MCAVAQTNANQKRGRSRRRRSPLKSFSSSESLSPLPLPPHRPGAPQSLIGQALHIAIARGHPATVQALLTLKDGVHAEYKDEWTVGRPPSPLLFRRFRRLCSVCPPACAAADSSPMILRRLRPQGFTPLMTAAREGQVECIKVLMREGANYHAITNGARSMRTPRPFSSLLLCLLPASSSRRGAAAWQETVGPPPPLRRNPPPTAAAAASPPLPPPQRSGPAWMVAARAGQTAAVLYFVEAGLLPLDPPSAPPAPPALKRKARPPAAAAAACRQAVVSADSWPRQLALHALPLLSSGTDEEDGPTPSAPSSPSSSSPRRSGATRWRRRRCALHSTSRSRKASSSSRRRSWPGEPRRTPWTRRAAARPTFPPCSCLMRLSPAVPAASLAASPPHALRCSLLPAAASRRGTRRS